MAKKRRETWEKEARAALTDTIRKIKSLDQWITSDAPPRDPMPNIEDPHKLPLSDPRVQQINLLNALAETTRSLRRALDDK